MAQNISLVDPLKSGVTYASRWTLTDFSDKITGSIVADQPGTIFIEQSGDGSNADVSASYNFQASSGEGFSEDLILPYFRIRVTNTSGSDQTAVRLFTHCRRGENP